ncbi:MAG: hypothetical protein U0670_19835 [Anaerolineae bacterium]
MTDSNAIGFERVQAKPIIMTFYDWLRTYPYTSTFYVRAEATDDDCHRLIRAIQVMSACILGQYKIGYRPFLVRDLDEQFKAMQPAPMGTFKWRISYMTSLGSRAHTIPAYKIEHSMSGYPGLRKANNYPNLEHPDWKHFLTVWREVGVSSEGEAIPTDVQVKASKSNWPPPGAKKRH